MDLTLAQIAAGWPLAASLATVAARGAYAGRRRSALNEALHELRRPLQALALVAPRTPGEERTGIEWSVQMAAVALERLEREINGEEGGAALAPVRIEPLARAAVDRWSERAARAGGSLRLRWGAGEATVEGDRCAIAQALDNLVVNAIEHGGPEVAVEAREEHGRLVLAVTDSGRPSRPAARRRRPAELAAWLSGRDRHGHGLRVVRRVAAEHGGDFRLHRSGRGTAAVLRLPLSGWGAAG